MPPPFYFSGKGGEQNMWYLVAIILPPVAVLRVSPAQAPVNLVLTLLGFIPGMLHALLVVHNFYANARNEQIVNAIARSR